MTEELKAEGFRRTGAITLSTQTESLGIGSTIAQLWIKEGTGAKQQLTIVIMLRDGTTQEVYHSGDYTLWWLSEEETHA